MRNSEQHKALMNEFEYLGKPAIHQLAQIDAENGEKDDGTIQGLTQENFLLLHDVAKRAQKIILDYQALHGSLQNLRRDVIEHMRLNLFPKQDVMPTVAAYALSAGTAKLPEVIKALYEDLTPQDVLDVSKTFKEECQTAIDSLPRISFQPPLPVRFILEGGDKAYKALYPNYSTAACLQLIEKGMSGELPGSCFHELVGLMKPEKGGESWVASVTGDVSYLLGQRPVKPLLHLRLAINGRSTPTNRECSQRLTHAIRSAMGPNGLPAHEGSFEEYAEFIRSNDFFYEKLLVQDLTTEIKREVDENEDNPPQDFDFGVEAWMRLSAFLKALKLGDDELSVIALMSVDGSSLGSAYDSALDNPAAGAIAMSKLLFRSRNNVKEAIETQVKRSIAFALWHSMSQFAMGQALQTDAGKFVMYKLTNNRLLLNGLKDKSLVDQAFGADLGL